MPNREYQTNGESHTPNHSSLAYRPELDGLRGIAVLVVIAFHAGVPHVSGGLIGVDVFFVLSGYLITSILLRESGKYGRIDFWNFYRSRFLRLMPAYYAAIAVAMLFPSHLPKLGMSRLEALATTGFYATNWVRAFHPAEAREILNGLGHFWSLAIEEQFYLLWPPVLALLLLKRRTSRKKLIAGLFVSVVAVELWRMWLWHATHSMDQIYNRLDTRADTLLLGCLLGCIPPGFADKAVPRPVQRLAGSVGALVLCFAVLRIGDDARLYQWGLTAVAWASALLLFALTQGDRWPVMTRLLSFRPLVWVGKVSYGAYVWHIFWLGWTPSLIPKIARHLYMDEIATYRIFAIVMALVLAAISYYVIERPFLILKERIRQKEREKALSSTRQ